MVVFVVLACVGGERRPSGGGGSEVSCGLAMVMDVGVVFSEGVRGIVMQSARGE